MNEEREKCPICGYQLSKKWEGLVCKNWKCKLYFKLETGWVKLSKYSNWSKQKVQVNGFYSTNSRLYLAKQFADVKQKALLRDDYTCQHCKEFKTGNDFTVPIDVHHIIPASKEMAMYLDLDNLITLCKNCHFQIHSLDKKQFKPKVTE